MFKFNAGFLFLAFLLLAGCANQKGNKPAGTEKVKTISRQNAAVNYNDFYFVGVVKQDTGILKYDFKSNRVKDVWSKRNEKVVELSYSPNRNAVFFLTAGDFGKKGVFPFIDNLKLYFINIDSGKVKFVKKLGSGLQVFTAWESDNTFKVILNSFDNTVANYVNRQTFIFSEFGRVLINESKTFDITKEGYPRPPEIKSNMQSPSGKYSIVPFDSLNTSIYLKNISGMKTYLITTGNQKLNQVEWTADGKYVIISTLNITPRNKTLYDKKPNTSCILVYSLNQKKILTGWSGGGIKNFFITNDLLIFDDNFGNNSVIKIFSLKTFKLTNTIRIPGGCGLRNIPAIPDYSA